MLITFLFTHIYTLLHAHTNTLHRNISTPWIIYGITTGRLNCRAWMHSAFTYEVFPHQSLGWLRFMSISARNYTQLCNYVKCAKNSYETQIFFYICTDFMYGRIIYTVVMFYLFSGGDKTYHTPERKRMSRNSIAVQDQQSLKIRVRISLLMYF